MHVIFVFQYRLNSRTANRKKTHKEEQVVLSGLEINPSQNDQTDQKHQLPYLKTPQTQLLPFATEVNQPPQELPQPTIRLQESLRPAHESTTY
jgi:hypothetical protein